MRKIKIVKKAQSELKEVIPFTVYGNTDTVSGVKIVTSNVKVQKKKKINDYGVPVMRDSVDTSSQNVGRRTGLSQPQLKKEKELERRKWQNT